MFDRYIPVPDLQCPGCGRTLREWQGYEGPCGLFVWRQGAKSPVDQTVDDEDAKLPPDGLAHWRLPGRFVIRCYCDCGRRISAEGTCHGDAWTDTLVISDIA